MNSLLLALSLSNSFTKIGAIAAFVALAGIAVLSLLVFSQAREIKRLRDWAGRAPERAAELEQRVSADASARLRPEAARPQSRVVPRAAPLVSAPVSSALAASGVTAATQAVPSPSGRAPVAAAQPDAPAEPTEANAPRSSAASAAGGVARPVGAEPSAVSEVSSQRAASQAAPVAAPAPAPQSRSPLPPSPSDPRPAVAKPAAATLAASATASSGAATTPGAASPPPPATAAGSARAAAPARVSASRAVRPAPAARSAAPPREAKPAETAAGAGRRDYRQQRSPARATLMILGGVIVLALVLALAVSVLKGGGSPTASTTASTGEASTKSPAAHRTSTQAAAVKPAQVQVAVLNGTSTTGLAHHLAGDLQQSGYTQASASAAVPPGTHQSTVVQYTSGHRAEGEAVAKTLNVRQVQPIESAIAAQAGSATVIVLAGADQAALLGGGGAQSQGEPAASGAGSGATGEAAGGQ